MTGKKTVLIIVLSTIIILVIAWFLLQFVIDKYNLDSANSNTTEIVTEVLSTSHLFDHNIV